MAYILAALGVFGVISVSMSYLTAPKLFWTFLPFVLGFGAACLIDVQHWWLGAGVAGIAMIAKVIEALLLMLTDYVMIEIQRGGRLRR